MATIAAVIRERHGDLKNIRRLSLAVDAAQEAAEREVVRLLNRKRSVPEPKDLDRIVALMNAQDAAQANLAQVIQNTSEKWSGY